MNRYFFALGLGPAVALGACGGSAPITTVDNIIASDTIVPENGSDANVVAGAAAMTGQDFADAVGAGDAYAVTAGELARQKATMPALRDFGQAMARAHAESAARLKVAGARAVPVILPDPRPSAEQAANLETLRQATGADFDAAYKAQQIAAQEKALAVMRDYAANGTVPALKAFAAASVPAVRARLDKIQGL